MTGVDGAPPVRRLYPHVALRRLPRRAPEKIACLTLDLEHDYGTRTGAFRVLRHEAELDDLRAFMRREAVPLSGFVVTELLDRWAGAAALARLLGDEWHSHSHRHRAAVADGAAEIAAAVAGFRRHFGRAPAGYRAPMGRLDPDDVPRLAAAGFTFSASIFPSCRPGVYDHRRAPLVPLRYANGLIELPFGAVRGLRLPLAVSYFKLLGWRAAGGLLRLLGTPPVAVVGFHLHDVIVDEASLGRLPLGVRAAYSVRRREGRAVLAALVRHLRAAGYTFLTMSELCHLCREAAGDAAA